ncbi:unnamed protein product [Bursaphelenchus okinawaensis]|uniref:Uncharacterized protein n=1 Tax=Bursaphelenchus okinawaensis TaxID=465554 RepID=A0A811KAL3_9BILA|nr:unnamed protein product [Bursaphelenchus okinawaensis]CAG9097605.1 unnamed protein product [Bursaphelenchus okinawaensis]
MAFRRRTSEQSQREQDLDCEGPSRPAIVQHSLPSRISRYVLRRKVCQITMVIALVLAMIFAPMYYFTYVIHRTLEFKKFVLDRQAWMAENTMKKSQAFLHEEFCLYYPNISTSVDACRTQCGPHAYVHVEHELISTLENPILCNSKLELSPCFKSLNKSKGCIDEKLKKTISSTCLNKNQIVPWDIYANANKTNFKRLYMPIITNDKLKSLQGQTVFAHQLVVKCPICSKRFQSYRLNDKSECYTKYFKAEKGLPESADTCGEAFLDRRNKSNFGINKGGSSSVTRQHDLWTYFLPHEWPQPQAKDAYASYPTHVDKPRALLTT